MMLLSSRQEVIHRVSMPNLTFADKEKIITHNLLEWTIILAQICKQESGQAFESGAA